MSPTAVILFHKLIRDLLSRFNNKLTTDQADAVPDTKISGEFSVPGTKVSSGFSVPGTKVSGRFSVPGTKVSGRFSVPGTKVSGEFSVPGTKVLRLLLAVLLMLMMLAGCQADGTETDLASTSEEVNAAERVDQRVAGNLHYQNFVYQIGQTIVYTSADDTLKRSRINASLDATLSLEPGSQFASSEEFLFYTESRISGALYKMDHDGTNRVRISHTITKYLLQHQDLLYAIDIETHQPFSLSPDGTNRQILHDAMATNQVLYGNDLYIAFASADQGVWHFNLETGDAWPVLAKTAVSINVADGWLYYSDPNQQDRIFASELPSSTDSEPDTSSSTTEDESDHNVETQDESESERINQTDNTNTHLANQVIQISDKRFDKPFILHEGYLYAPDPERQYRLFRWPVLAGQSIDLEHADMIIDDVVASFVILSDYIYYQRPESLRIYRVPIDGGRPVRIT